MNKFSVSATLVLTVEETLTAHTVTFDPNGGTLSEGEMSSKSVFPGDAYGALPTPTRVNYRFDGWFTEKDGGTKVEETTIMSSRAAHTLYAHWTPIHVHAYTQQVQKPEALKTPADCTNNAVYYLSCACGEVSTNDADTFTAANTALDHDWGAWSKTAMKRPTPESVSVTPAIRKPRIATAARPPAPKEQHAQFAVRNMAMLWDMILLPVDT